MKRCAVICSLLFLLAPSGGLGQSTNLAQPAAFLLRTNAEVESAGVFLNQLALRETGSALPQIRLADAPAFGQALTLTPAQINHALQNAASHLVPAAWSGAAQIRVTRRERTLSEAELKELLIAALQREQLTKGDELDLRFTRAWTPVSIPDEPFTFKVLDLPASGINSYLILRFELGNTLETFGTWQVAVQAKVWREVLVAKSALKRAQILTDEVLAHERRDVLTLRDTMATLPSGGHQFEMVTGLAANQPLTPRVFRIRPLVFRGQTVEAFAREGSMTISMIVEVLEDGIAGDFVRLRNPRSKRELRGIVQNEKSILVSL